MVGRNNSALFVSCTFYYIDRSSDLLLASRRSYDWMPFILLLLLNIDNYV